MKNFESQMLFYPFYGCFLFILIGCAIIDIRHRRIPNIFTFTLIIFALILHAVNGGLAGFLFGVKGLGFGFIALLVPYILGGVGAGDVKLMAAVGTVFGVDQTLMVFIVIAVLGGFTALMMMAVRGEIWITLCRIGVMLYGFLSGAGLAAFKVDRSILKRDGIPYGAVIAGGTWFFFAWHWFSGQGLPLPRL